jgi:hypothetical protein
MSDETKNKSEAADVARRRDEARKFFKDNIYDELTDVHLNLKCRTKPIMKKDSAGNKTTVEDTSRTNVAMPDTNIIYRRNTARMTAQPYRLRYIGASDPAVNEMLSAQARQQYDRSDEQYHDRRVVAMGEAFGFGYSKLYDNELKREMPIRKLLIKDDAVVFNDRASIMAHAGAPEEEIGAAVQQLGPEMTPDEVTQFAAQNGPEIVIPTSVVKYQGPCLKSVFIGDLFLEPGAESLDDSNFVIEQYLESDLWLKKMVKTKYKNDDGQWVPAFDSDACESLLKLQGDDQTDSKNSDDLRRAFNDAIGKDDGRTNTKFQSSLRMRKKWQIIEQHALADDGRIWVTWVADKMRDKVLGKMPYPWDFYGKYAYTAYVPLQDFISPWGDSTPRLLRYLQAMKNLTVAQNFDYITNLLRKFLLMKSGTKLEPEIVERGLFRLLKIDGPLSDLQYLQEPSLPAGAFERVAHLNSEIGKLEPSINNVESGSSLQPMAGKTATTAILAARVADALMQYKIDGRNIYLKEIGEKKLAMNQQVATDAWEIESQFWGPELAKRVQEVESAFRTDPNSQAPTWALTDRNGKVVATRLDPYEIQEDIGVEPEAGSYLAVDDEIFKQSIMEVQQVNAANPGVLDPKKLVRKQLEHIRGIGNIDELFLPDPTGPQLPETRMNVALSIAFKDLPFDVQNQILPMIGLQPSQELEHKATLDGVKQLSEAADAAANLHSPATPPELDKGLKAPNLRAGDGR